MNTVLNIFALIGAFTIAVITMIVTTLLVVYWWQERTSHLNAPVEYWPADVWNEDRL